MTDASHRMITTVGRRFACPTYDLSISYLLDENEMTLTSSALIFRSISP
jgi:hypothetical protein